MTVDIVPYKSFPKDLRRLPAISKVKLRWALERLATAPYDPDLQKSCAIGADENYAFDLGGGYIMYWQLISESDPLSVTASAVTHINVLLLAITGH